MIIHARCFLLGNWPKSPENWAKKKDRIKRGSGLHGPRAWACRTL